jgi:hypothetical protein
VASIDRSSFTVTLDGDVRAVSDGLRATAMMLRRWDRPAGVLALGGEGQATDGSMLIQEDPWIELEAGVQVYFEHVALFRRTYRRGDDWLIPARTATGDVLWPA